MSKDELRSIPENTAKVSSFLDFITTSAKSFNKINLIENASSLLTLKTQIESEYSTCKNLLIDEEKVLTEKFIESINDAYGLFIDNITQNVAIRYNQTLVDYGKLSSEPNPIALDAVFRTVAIMYKLEEKQLISLYGEDITSNKYLVNLKSQLKDYF